MTSTSARSTGRQRAMAFMLALAIAGAVIRHFAPPASTLHDVGTLLLVLWLPAVGNLIAWLVRRIPRRPPPATEFTEGSAFTPHLQATLAPAPEAPAVLATLQPGARGCTVIVGRQGFTTRVEHSVAQALAAGPESVTLEFLHPGGALPQLQPGTRFFLLVGTTAVATGHVVSAMPAAPPARMPR